MIFSTFLIFQNTFYNVSVSSVEKLLSYNDARYNRENTIAYAEAYRNEKSGNNIDGINLNNRGGDSAHFVSCAIGNPPQRYLTMPEICGGLSLQNYKNDGIYGFANPNILFSYLTETNKERPLPLAKITDKFEFSNKNVELSEIEIQTLLSYKKKLMPGDYIHLIWSDSTSKSILNGNDNTIYGHSDPANEDIVSYLNKNIRFGHKPKEINFVHIFDDPIKENNYEQSFNKGDLVKYRSNKYFLQIHSGPGFDYKEIIKIEKSDIDTFIGKIVSNPRSLDGRMWHLVEFNNNIGWIWEGMLASNSVCNVPAPISPKGDITEIKPTFTWTTIVSIEKYIIEIDGIKYPANSQPFISNIKSGTHKWRIASVCSGNKQSEWSDFVSFTISLNNQEKDFVELTLLLYEDSSDGKLLSDTRISGTDGEGSPFVCSTNEDGYAVIYGKPSINEDSKTFWSFEVNKHGFVERIWSMPIYISCIKKAVIKKEETSDELITVKLYVHDFESNGPISGAIVEGFVGREYFIAITKEYGEAVILGKSGYDWSFSVGKDGYVPIYWKKPIYESTRLDFYIKKITSDCLPPTQILPSESVTLLSPPYYFSWSRVSGYQYYQIVFYDEKKIEIKSEGNIKDTNIQFTDLSQKIKYWRIKTQCPNRENGWSNYRSVSIGCSSFDEKKVSLKLVVHEGNPGKTTISEAVVLCKDGNGIVCTGSTNNHGIINVCGFPSGNKWSLTVSKIGYKTIEWNQYISSIKSMHVYLERKEKPLRKKPKFLTPLENAVITKPYNFSWSSVARADYYHINFYDADKKDLGGNADLQMTSISYADLSEKTKYWRVRAHFDDGWGHSDDGWCDWSDYRSITIVKRTSLIFFLYKSTQEFSQFLLKKHQRLLTIFF